MLKFFGRYYQDFGNINTIEILDFALQRSCLEYASSVQLSHYTAHILAREKMKKSSLKLVGFELNLSQNIEYDALDQINSVEK